MMVLSGDIVEYTNSEYRYNDESILGNQHKSISVASS